MQTLKTPSGQYLLSGYNMVKDDRAKGFSCLKCGTPYMAYPPDDFHYDASIKEKDVEDPIKVDYKCKECGNMNTLYWGWVRISAVF